jgi:hypothetical protein
VPGVWDHGKLGIGNGLQRLDGMLKSGALIEASSSPENPPH